MLRLLVPLMIVKVESRLLGKDFLLVKPRNEQRYSWDGDLGLSGILLEGAGRLVKFSENREPGWNETSEFPHCHHFCCFVLWCRASFILMQLSLANVRKLSKNKWDWASYCSAKLAEWLNKYKYFCWPCIISIIILWSWSLKSARSGGKRIRKRAGKGEKNWQIPLTSKC